MSSDDSTRNLYLSGAILFGLGALTGVLVSATFTGKLSAQPHFMLAAHLNALMGCFWLVCLGTTWDRLELTARWARVLKICTMITAYANWGVTLLKSLLKVQGIDYIGETSNDAIFGLLTIFVVIPTFVASFLWIRGLWPPKAATTS